MDATFIWNKYQENINTCEKNIRTFISTRNKKLFVCPDINPVQNWSDMQRTALETLCEMDTLGVLCLTTHHGEGILGSSIKPLLSSAHTPGTRSRRLGPSECSPSLEPWWRPSEYICYADTLHSALSEGGRRTKY